MNHNVGRIRRVKRVMRTDPQYHYTTEKADAVIDLLTDLRHFCDSKGWDFDTCVRVAGDHFISEHTREARRT